MFVRKLLCALLIACLLPLGALAQDTPEPDAPAIPEGYEIVAENAEWTLYLLRDTLALIMRHNESGRVMYSTVQNADDMQDNDKWKGFYQSGIVLEYIQGTVMDYPWANLHDTPNEKLFNMFDNGFSCEVYYPGLGIAYQVTVTLDGGCLTIDIPQSGIREERPDEFVVSSFYVYPFMGYAHMGEPGGYMLIPDGQGAVIELKDNEGRFTSPYAATVYGKNIGLATTATSVLLGDFSMSTDPERAMMPVFGMRHADSALAYAAVIEEGDISAMIQASMNGVSNMAFDWICAKYTYRLMYSQQTGPSSGTVNMRTQRAKRFDIRQHFYFLQGEDADYCGMAKAYRQHLGGAGAFDNADSTEAFAMQVDIVGGDRENGIIGTTPVVMTTYEQAGDIYAALIEQGAASLISVYKGWDQYGMYGSRPTTGYNPEASLGGKNGLSRLQTRAQALGVTLALYTNLLDLVSDTHRTLAYSALKKIDTSTFKMPVYGKVYGGDLLFLTPPRSADLARDVADAYAKNSVPAVALDGITQLITDYSLRNTYYDGNDCANHYREAASALRAGRSLLLNKPNALLWPYANALTETPIGGSHYRYVTSEVPFMAIALSGRMPIYAEYVNFQANTKRFFLQLVEQGARPAFLVSHEDPIALLDTNVSDIYSSRYDLYEDMMVEYYAELSALHAATQGSAIDRHTREGDLVTVTYANGTVIYINYGERAASIGGHALDGLSYKVVTANDR